MSSTRTRIAVENDEEIEAIAQQANNELASVESNEATQDFADASDFDESDDKNESESPLSEIDGFSALLNDPVLMQLRAQMTFVYHNSIAPNSYNPNQMSEGIYEAEKLSILRFGFIDPIAVRIDIFTDEIIIVDGEHRWRGFDDVRALWMTGQLTPFEIDPDDLDAKYVKGTCHPSLIPLFERNAVPIFNLGRISEIEAKRLTVILNETRGKANVVDLATLMAQVATVVGVEELQIGTPYTNDELGELLKMGDYDWSANSDADSSSSSGESEGGSDNESYVTFQVSMPASAHAVWLEARARVKASLAEDGRSLPQNEKTANGVVLELLSADFNAGPTPASESE